MSWEELDRNGYLVIKNWIPKEAAVELGEEFNRFVSVHGERDEQVPTSLAYHNYLPFVELLCGMTGDLNRRMGRAYLPSYVYARRYNKESILVRHSDRPACETSMTVNFGGDRKWGIWIVDKSGLEVEVKQEPGDALLYQGCTQEHWRNCFQGFSYTQAFFHYVESRGPNRDQWWEESKKCKPLLLPEVEPLTNQTHGIRLKK